MARLRPRSYASENRDSSIGAARNTPSRSQPSGRCMPPACSSDDQVQQAYAVRSLCRCSWAHRCSKHTRIDVRSSRTQPEAAAKAGEGKGMSASKGVSLWRCGQLRARVTGERRHRRAADQVRIRHARRNQLHERHKVDAKHAYSQQL